jgi:hypothetical protein
LRHLAHRAFQQSLCLRLHLGNALIAQPRWLLGPFGAMARPISVHARFKALCVSKCRHTTPEIPPLYQFLFACKVLILSPIKGTKKFHKFLSK